MPGLIGAATLWFSGYALLVSVAPLWAIRGGSGSLGAGLVTGVMMACTVLAQLSMHRVLAGLGWRWTLVLGSGLLGLPALGHLVTDQLWAVTGLAALRGLGFGVITVCGATAVAALVEPGRRGRALGAFGLSSAAPQFVLVPAAPWLAERAGFWLVFVLAAAPALAIPLAGPIARTAGGSDRAPSGGSGPGPAALRRALSGPIAALAVITASGGAILTFAPHILASPALTFWGLFAFTGAAAASRWAAGGIADRFGPAPAIAPLLFTGALGLAAIGLRADGIHDDAARALIIWGLLVAGIAYGGVQNLTLAQAFSAAGEPARATVSIVWNLSFDAGTGIGAFGTGAIATATSFPVAFAVLALAVALAGGGWALPRRLTPAERADFSVERDVRPLPAGAPRCVPSSRGFHPQRAVMRDAGAPGRVHGRVRLSRRGGLRPQPRDLARPPLCSSGRRGPQGRGALAWTVEPVPARRFRPQQRGIRTARRAHGPLPGPRRRGVQLLRAGHRQHGTAAHLRHRRAAAALA
jgi:hypothetical protein